MSTFTFIPSTSARRAVAPRVRRVAFGDGYEQRVADGINTRAEEWGLSFVGKTDTEANAIETFLEARGGVESFNWTTPKGEAIKVVCDRWDRTFSEINMNTISAVFRRVYEP